MSCNCKYDQNGLCTRYPKTNTVVMGKLVWAFPPADRECGERVPAEKVKKAAPKKAKKGDEK